MIVRGLKNMSNIGGITTLNMGWYNSYLKTVEAIKEQVPTELPKIHAGESLLITGVHISISEAGQLASNGIRPPIIDKVTYTVPDKVRSVYLPKGIAEEMKGE